MLAERRRPSSFYVPNESFPGAEEGPMAIALAGLAVAVAAMLLLGAKVFAVFGVVVACAMFSFPIGLIGLVGIGVSLLFLLAPRQQTD